MTVIDSDTHVVEDAMIWDYVSKTDAAYKPVPMTADEDSHLAYSSGGRQFWLIDGRLFGRGGQPGPMYAEGTRTLGDPAARVADMDRYGHDIQVIYPSLFLNLWCKAVAAERAAVRAYNRWMADVCAPFDGRLRWVALPVVRDSEASLAEMEFGRDHGACGVMLRGYEGDRSLDDPGLDALYAKACDLDMPVCIHIGNGSPSYGAIANSKSGQRNVLGNSMPTLIAFAALTLSDIPSRFPGLRIGFIEAASEWVPYAVSRCRKMLSHYGIRDTTETLFADNRFYVTCESTEDVNYVASVTGPENLLIGTDYGHADTSTELEAPRLLREREDLSADLTTGIVHANAKRFYAL